MTDHKASMPKGPVIATFVPLKSFPGETEDGQLLGNYKQGKTYYLREGNEVLPPLLEQWEADGLVRVNR